MKRMRNFYAPFKMPPNIYHHMNFESVIVSLQFDRVLTKDKVMKILAIDNVELSLPTISPSSIPILSYSVLSYEGLLITIFNARLSNKEKTILQTTLNNTDLDKINSAISKLYGIGNVVDIPFSVEINAKYTIDYELKRTAEVPFKSRIGYIFVDFKEGGDLRALDYVLDVRISPYPLDSTKTLVQVIYRDKKVERFNEILGKIEEFVRSDK
ncbi:hypothetical protein [Metallosphaera javensis (ex Hofmann et al. 2022)]|uniref:hypothetical protein n=1 Tax=Metallosphaera javensis (ex Hofmann et al. 2022) TaxID=99938 RepID=UPI001EDDDB97|nr:hypothetical protein [Metallosphaera javensis (ex Hofmann et al. 2022)]